MANVGNSNGERGAHWLTAIVGGVVLACSATVAAHAAEPTSMRTAGSCDHLSTAVRVDAQGARALIPSDFVLLEPAPGTAVMAIVTQDCMTSVNGGPTTRAVNSVAFIFVDPVRSPAGCEVYDLFWTNGRDDAWYRAMKRIGTGPALSPETRLTLLPTGPGIAGVAANPYRRAPFSYSATGVDTVNRQAPFPLASVHCQLGRRGLVRHHYDHQMTVGAGTATYRLGPSRLWGRLGARPGTSAALLARFTWTGVIEIVKR